MAMTTVATIPTMIATAPPSFDQKRRFFNVILLIFCLAEAIGVTFRIADHRMEGAFRDFLTATLTKD